MRTTLSSRRSGALGTGGGSLFLSSLALLLAVLPSPAHSAEPTTEIEAKRARALLLEEAQKRLPEWRARWGDDIVRMGPHELDLEQARIQPNDLDPSADQQGGGGWVTTTWTPYAGPFGIEEAAHLLHRTVCGATWQEIEDAAGQGLAATVAQLLAAQPAPAAPGPWATAPIPDMTGWTEQMMEDYYNALNDYGNILRGWWPDVIVDAGPNITESMTHFWHDHFATAMDKVYYPQSMYTQNALLRANATGNFRDLTLAVSLDPAMLLWLDNQWNWVDQINENFARELLELFTLGVGNYTQQDIVETARSFTGYITYDGVTSQLEPWAHDYGTKTVLGQTGEWFAEDIIDIIFEQDQCARFICTKLYQWYVDQYPDPQRIDELAAILRANDYEVLPVLQTILLSEHFFDPEFRGAVISDGIDHYLGRVRTFGLADQVTFSDYMSNEREWMNWSMSIYNHRLLDPPNVAGWPGYRTWINSYTLPWRKELDVSLVNGEIYGWPLGMQVDALALGQGFPTPNNPYNIVDGVADLLFGMPPTELVRQRMLDELLQGAQPWEWNIGDPNATDRLEGLLRLALRLPDAQTK